MFLYFVKYLFGVSLLYLFAYLYIVIFCSLFFIILFCFVIAFFQFWVACLYNTFCIVFC